MDVLDFAVTPLLGCLSEPASKAVLKRASRLSVQDGQALHARGDEAPRLTILTEGAVRLGRFQPNGSFNLVSEIGVGAHFGDVSLQRDAFSHNSYAMGDGEIAVVKAAALYDLMHDQPEFAFGLWRANNLRLNALLELYDDARTLDITTRLAKVIYVHMGRGEIQDGVACLQRTLAELLGVSQVSVGNGLKELEKARLVETGYRYVKVPDKARLKAWIRRGSSG